MTTRAPAQGNGHKTKGPVQTVRVATYMRISTDEKHQPYSLEAQDTRLRAFAESQPDWRIVKAHEDRASGASVDKRDGLRRALRDARAGRYDVLLVYRVDRLSRSLRDFLDILDALTEAGVTFRSATEPVDTATPMGRMLVQLLAMFAEFERGMIIDRVVAGMERKAARGEWPGGIPSHGYEVADEGGLVVNAAEAPIIPVIFKMYDEGRGAKAIATELNRQGHRTRNEKRWGHTSVLALLRNRTYVGEVSFRGQHYPGQHPPLVEADLFERVQARLASQGDDRSHRAVTDYLLAGVLVCDRCGGRYVGNAAHGRSRRYRYYSCSSRVRGLERCDNERVPADAVEAAVLDALLGVYAQPDLFARACEAATEAGQEGRQQRAAELTALEAEIRKAEAAVERYMLAFEDGKLAADRFGQRVEELTVRVVDLRQRHADLTDELAEAATVTAPSASELKDLRGRIAAAIEAGTDAMRRTMLQGLVQELRVVARDRVLPTFRLRYEEENAVRTRSTSVGRVGFEPT